MVWYLLLMSSDALDVIVGHYFGTNDFTPYVTMPLEVGTALWVLAAFHEEERIRRAYELAIIGVGAGTALLLLLTDPGETFDRWITPLLGVVALAASMHTLVRRSLASYEGLTSQGWFWVCLGMALFWFGFATVPPFAYAVMDSRMDLARAAYIARAWSHPPAYLLMTWGTICQTAPNVSSSSS